MVILTKIKTLRIAQKMNNITELISVSVSLDTKCAPLNPIPTEGGHFGPRRSKAVSHFHSFMTRVTKIHDFVHLSIPLVPVKLFLHARHSQGHV